MSGAKTCFTCQYRAASCGDEPCCSCLREPTRIGWHPIQPPPAPSPPATGPAAGTHLWAIAAALDEAHADLKGIRLSRAYSVGLDGCLAVRELAMFAGVELCSTVYADSSREPFVIETARHTFPSGLVVEMQSSRLAVPRDASLPGYRTSDAEHQLTPEEMREVLSPPCSRCQSDPAVGGGLCAGCAATVER